MNQLSQQVQHRYPIPTCGLFVFDWTVLFTVRVTSGICQKILYINNRVFIWFRWLVRPQSIWPFYWVSNSWRFSELCILMIDSGNYMNVRFFIFSTFVENSSSHLSICKCIAVFFKLSNVLIMINALYCEKLGVDRM